jgi:U4/U6 small nuclear ribonucleoprotein PRP31
MEIIAPNLSVLVGADIAAKLITSAGGICELSFMPACNLMVLGSKNVALNGFSTKGRINQGYLYEVETVKNEADVYKTKALRKLAGKCSLAARCDAFRDRGPLHRDSAAQSEFNRITSQKNEDDEFGYEYFDDDLKEAQLPTKPVKQDDHNKHGKRFKEIINSKLDKIKNLKNPTYIKPLPRPDDKPKKRRGGARLRKNKEEKEITEVMKAKNRLLFGKEGEIEYGLTGQGFGMLGVAGTNPKVKVKKIKPFLGQKRKNNLNEHIEPTIPTQGMHSTLAFNSAQGISLINPQLINNSMGKSEIKNDSNYFSNEAGFTTVISKAKKA